MLCSVIFVGIFASSCLSDKKIVYLQGAETTYKQATDIQQVYELVVQPDDQLAISVSSKTRELIEPFNTNTLIGGGSSLNTGSTANVQSGVSYFLVDKDGNILTDEDLRKRVITHKSYYDLVLPIRKRINDELARQKGESVA